MFSSLFPLTFFGTWIGTIYIDGMRASTLLSTLPHSLLTKPRPLCTITTPTPTVARYTPLQHQQQHQRSRTSSFCCASARYATSPELVLASFPHSSSSPSPIHHGIRLHCLPDLQSLTIAVIVRSATAVPLLHHRCQSPKRCAFYHQHCRHEASTM